MPPKPKNRNRWNDVQTAIAAMAIAVTLGMWNLFATPAKAVTAQTEEPTTIPPTEPPVTAEPTEPTALPKVKIMFTQGATQVTAAQQQPQQVTAKKKRKKKDNNGGGGGGGGSTVTQTKSS